MELEGVIQGGLQTFTEVGLALLEIRDSRLYRFGGYATVDDYLRERWPNEPVVCASTHREKVGAFRARAESVTTPDRVVTRMAASQAD